MLGHAGAAYQVSNVLPSRQPLGQASVRNCAARIRDRRCGPARACIRATDCRIARYADDYRSVSIPIEQRSAETSHDRVRSRKHRMVPRAALVRGFRPRRTLRDSEPHHDVGGVRGVPDRERRHPSGALRRRILPRPRHAGPAGARLPDADPHRARAPGCFRSWSRNRWSAFSNSRADS